MAKECNHKIWDMDGRLGCDDARGLNSYILPVEVPLSEEPVKAFPELGDWPDTLILLRTYSTASPSLWILIRLLFQQIPSRYGRSVIGLTCEGAQYRPKGLHDFCNFMVQEICGVCVGKEL